MFQCNILCAKSWLFCCRCCNIFSFFRTHQMLVLAPYIHLCGCVCVCAYCYIPIFLCHSFTLYIAIEFALLFRLNFSTTNSQFFLISLNIYCWFGCSSSRRTTKNKKNFQKIPKWKKKVDDKHFGGLKVLDLWKWKKEKYFFSTAGNPQRIFQVFNYYRNNNNILIIVLLNSLK